MSTTSARLLAQGAQAFRSLKDSEISRTTQPQQIMEESFFRLTTKARRACSALMGNR
jgi:hypothetical protein